MEGFKDYYQILGLSKDATEIDIKKSYRELAKKYHPDKHPELSDEEKLKLEEKFKMINEAYEILHNADKRIMYDMDYSREMAKRMRKQQEQAKKQEQSRKNQENAKRAAYESRRSQENNYSRSNTTHNKKDETNASKIKNGFKSYVEQIKKHYKQVRRDEKKYPFKKRHDEINEDLYEDSKDMDNEFLFILKGIGYHTILESIYQVSKLRTFAREPFTKAFIRNRRMILAGILLSTIIIGSNQSKIDAKDKQDDIQVTYTTEAQEAIDNYESEIVLMRYKKIGITDTLSQFAEDTQSSQNTIENMNNISNHDIYFDEEIKLPYRVKKEDLSYYTKSALVNNDITLDEFASLYETDVETLKKLNEEAIVTDNNQTIVLSDTLTVPNFISYHDYREAKANTNSYTKSNE